MKEEAKEEKMKKIEKLLLMLVVIAIGFVAPFIIFMVFSNPPESGIIVRNPPESGKLLNSATPSFQVYVADEKTTMMFPVRYNQENLGETPKLRVYASYVYNQNNKEEWLPSGQGNFVLETGELKEGHIPAYINFSSDQGTVWFWVRCWAKSSKSYHVWMDESSKFCRYSKEGKPGYEFLVSTGIEEISPVPASYQKREQEIK